jgi:hypothetical protein
VILAIECFGALWGTTVTLAQSPLPHQTLIEQLLGEEASYDEKSRALIDVREILYGLEKALISTLEQQGELHTQHHEEVMRGVETDIQISPEFLARLTEVVLTLRDPRSIPALISVLGNGSTATPAGLAAFGEEAVPGLIAVITPPEGPSHKVYGSLLTLRCMVDNSIIRTFSPETFEEIRSVIDQRLNMRQEFVTNLWRDIDLAIALGDQGLREIVQALASDEQAVIALGVTAPDLIQRTQTNAKDRLAGIPAVPNCQVYADRIDNRFMEPQ